ncbi:MAG TPA: chaperone modulator CbpM [Rhodoblastus sp.]|nr:chaperone modulator CbpM [Rhodoblastus sp.]
MNKQEFLITSGLEGGTLQLWIDQEWLIPQETDAGPTFSDRDVARARLIQDLKRDFGVNDEGVDVVLHLVDQLHGMRRLLALLRNDLRKDPV